MKVVMETDRGETLVVGRDEGVVTGDLGEQRQHRRRQHLDARVAYRVRRMLGRDDGGVDAAHADFEFHDARC